MTEFPRAHRASERRGAMMALSMIVAMLALTAASAAEERAVKSLLEIRHEHIVVQKWDLSCGAAALTTLLRYQFGDDVTEKAVATALIKRPEYIANPRLVQVRQGFSLLDLRRYVDGRGYEGVGLGKLNLQDLEEHAPILVPIHILGYNHFVVFRGRLGNRVLLADPAWGNRTMTVEQFESAWIDYPALGHVGFIVETKGENRAEPDMLRARPEDFVTFN
jgi:predicted double-glycine peptidase